ncbi:MAG: single-stranded DNA-binding protein [Actinobacteria bacterium]|nr:single-stranded DNA-binding protein [Actinomycetota bacterium]
MASNVNVVVLTGNLTRDPEMRHTEGGTAIAELRLAVNSRRKDGNTGEWKDKPNYFDVIVFGVHAENCAKYLSKGRPIAIEGRLDWREWEVKDGSGKNRQAVQIIANTVQFLGPKPEGEKSDQGAQEELSADSHSDDAAEAEAKAEEEEPIPF